MSKCEIVGILNITPDSFSDGGNFVDIDLAINHANQMLNQGSSFVDVGAESTNPWSNPLDSNEEWTRLEPVLSELLKFAKGRVSVDTYHPDTAERAIKIGVDIINDVTMLREPDMRELVLVNPKVRFIISHLSPKSATINDAHRVPQTTTLEEVHQELMTLYNQLISKGADSRQLILDPGIGFGKTMELNWQLLEFARYVPNIPVMIGHSKKRFLGEKRMEMEPNIEAAKIAINSGARYLRVHDTSIYQALC